MLTGGAAKPLAAQGDPAGPGVRGRRLRSGAELNKNGSAGHADVTHGHCLRVAGRVVRIRASMVADVMAIAGHSYPPNASSVHRAAPRACNGGAMKHLVSCVRRSVQASAS